MSSLSEKITESALLILEEEGLAALTMAEVARRSGVSVGTLYNNFADKDEILTAAHERFLASAATQDPLPAVELGGPAAERVRAAVTWLIGLLRRHEPLIRAFGAQGVHDPAIARRGSEHIQMLARSFTAYLFEARDAINRPNVDIAIDVCFRLTYDTAARTISHGPGFGTDYDLHWDALVDELIVACSAYLLDGQEP
jgi:AcrR family transcriptional regulator